MGWAAMASVALFSLSGCLIKPHVLNEEDLKARPRTSTRPEALTSCSERSGSALFHPGDQPVPRLPRGEVVRTHDQIPKDRAISHRSCAARAQLSDPAGHALEVVSTHVGHTLHGVWQHRPERCS